jgi:hypothetical protein
MRTKLVGSDTHLLRSRDELNHLLQSAGAMLVESNLHKGTSSVAHERVALLVVGVLQQLLAEVIAERICESQ